MKQILFTLFVFSIVFSSCNKEEAEPQYIYSSDTVYVISGDVSNKPVKDYLLLPEDSSQANLTAFVSGNMPYYDFTVNDTHILFMRPQGKDTVFYFKVPEGSSLTFTIIEYYPSDNPDNIIVDDLHQIEGFSGDRVEFVYQEAPFISELK